MCTCNEITESARERNRESAALLYALSAWRVRLNDRHDFTAAAFSSLVQTHERVVKAHWLGSPIA